MPITAHGNEMTGGTFDNAEITEVTYNGNVVFSAGPDPPPITSNLVHHYDANSASGSTASAWEDHENGHTLSAVDSEPSVLSNEYNGNNALHFDEDHMSGGDYPLTWPFTIVVCAETVVGSDPQFLFDHTGRGAGWSTHTGFYAGETQVQLVSDGDTVSWSSAVSYSDYSATDGDIYFYAAVFDTSDAVARFMQHSSSGSLSHNDFDGIFLADDSAYDNTDVKYTKVLAYNTGLSTSQLDTLYTHYRDEYAMPEQ